MDGGEGMKEHGYDEPCYICKKAGNIHESWCSRGNSEMDDFPGPEDILKMRGKEQPDEWEAWVQRMPMMTAFRGEWQQWFREMPPRGK
jgi:hypothetical protein